MLFNGTSFGGPAWPEIADNIDAKILPKTFVFPAGKTITNSTENILIPYTTFTLKDLI